MFIRFRDRSSDLSIGDRRVEAREIPRSGMVATLADAELLVTKDPAIFLGTVRGYIPARRGGRGPTQSRNPATTQTAMGRLRCICIRRRKIGSKQQRYAGHSRHGRDTRACIGSGIGGCPCRRSSAAYDRRRYPVGLFAPAGTILNALYLLQRNLSDPFRRFYLPLI